MWKVASMGAQNSPAIFVRVVTDMLNAYGICGGTMCDPSKLTDEGRLMHTIFRRSVSNQGEDETSPIFPWRVQIIQSGFEKPKLSSRKNPNWILAEDPSPHGGARDRYLSTGF